MSLSVREQILGYLGKVGGTANRAEVEASFETPRNESFVSGEINELVDAGELGQEIVESPTGDGIGFTGHILTWLRFPKPVLPELEFWQIPPVISELAKAGFPGDPPGVYADRAPPNSCAWSATFEGAGVGFETVEAILGGEELSAAQIRFEATDFLSQPRKHDFVVPIAKLLAVPEWSRNQEGEMRSLLATLRPGYPRYLAHWLAEPVVVNMGSREHPSMEERFQFPVRVFGSPAFRRSWCPYEVSHGWINV